MLRKHKLGKLAVVGTAVACAVFVLAVGATSFASPAKVQKAQVTHMVKVPGGTLTIAEAAAAGPNYIFPMMPRQYFSVTNFQLIYLCSARCTGSASAAPPDLNTELSLADPPVFSNGGRTVTVNMKGYKWSNGETRGRPGRRVLDEPGQGRTPPLGQASRPGPASSPVTSPTSSPQRPDTVIFTLDAAYSSYWFTYNELSQVSPLPIAWDIPVRRGEGRLGRLLERGVQVGHTSSTNSRVRSFRRLGGRQGLCRGLRVPLGQDRSRRPRHLRHEPVVADRRRALPPDRL